MNLFSLKGKRALIAGASRGIGLAIAKAVAEAGADTILAARSLPQLKTEAEALTAQGFKASVLPLDMMNNESVDAIAEAAGDLDILINVAGTNSRQKIESYSPEEYDRILQTNLHGIFRLCQKVGAKMIARGEGGKVIHIGSLTSGLGLPYLAPYAITKSAIGGLTRVMAAEWGKHNIQVNCIAPGFILTDLNREMWKAPIMANWLAGAQPNPRMGRPEDIAPLAVFLSSAGSDYITGQTIYVDGGYSTTAVWPFEPAQ
ncbi:MAG: SDR family oxidoreductase [Acidobacteria bacterium]|nr:SDR family oxidoreductase [Acidobacteriota bacterium]